MSTEGAGIVAVPVALAMAPAALGVAAVAGTGILIREGVMWCDKQLKEWYDYERNQYAAKAKAVRAANLARVRVVSMDSFAKSIDTMATTRICQSTDADTSSLAREAERQALLEAMTLARQAINDARKLTRASANAERGQIASRLMLEIENGRGLLPARIIAQAEDALEESPQVMQQEIENVQNAWNHVKSVQAAQERQRREVQHLLQLVTVQITVIEELLRNTSANTMQSTFAEQRQVIESMVKTSEAALDSSLDEAAQQARKARDAILSLAESVSLSLIDISNNIQSEVNTFQGILTTLSMMLEEAISTRLIAIQQAQQLNRRIVAITEEVQSLTEGFLSDTEQRIRALHERIELLKQEVFTTIEQGQQRKVAETIVTTLAELGFQSTNGDEPALRRNGDVLRVEALRTTSKKTGKRDDKIVSFDISCHGHVAYDFSGYVGDTCLAEAERIFAALRHNGVYILDEQAVQRLRVQKGDISIKALDRPDLQPSLQTNKLQAELAERLRTVLEQMQYGTITQNIVGGVIELEAFEGQIGYRVVLPADGSVQVFKDDAYSDVSADLQDPIVAEANRLLEQEEEEEEDTLPQRKSNRIYKPIRRVLEN